MPRTGAATTVVATAPPPTRVRAQHQSAQSKFRTSSQQYTQMGTDPGVACATTRRCGMMRARRQPEVYVCTLNALSQPTHKDVQLSLQYGEGFHLHVPTIASGIGNRQALPCATRFRQGLFDVSQTLHRKVTQQPSWVRTAADVFVVVGLVKV